MFDPGLLDSGMCHCRGAHADHHCSARQASHGEKEPVWQKILLFGAVRDLANAQLAKMHTGPEEAYQLITAALDC